MAVFIVIILWIVFTFILALVANNKGFTFKTYFLIGLFLSPLVGFIILHIMGKKKDTSQNGNLSDGTTKKCLVCGEMVDINAKICPYCRRSIFQGDIEEENDEDYEDDEIYEDDEEDETVKRAFDEIFAKKNLYENAYEENNYDNEGDEEEKDENERYSRHDKKREFDNNRDKRSEREEKTVSNNNNRSSEVKYYYCKHCGIKNTSVFGLINSSGCQKSPTKKHELYEGSEKTQYICKFCGVKNSSITGLVVSSYCPKSPSKRHEPAL